MLLPRLARIATVACVGALLSAGVLAAELPAPGSTAAPTIAAAPDAVTATAARMTGVAASSDVVGDMVSVSGTVTSARRGMRVRVSVRDLSVPGLPAVRVGLVRIPRSGRFTVTFQAPDPQALLDGAVQVTVEVLPAGSPQATARTDWRLLPATSAQPDSATGSAQGDGTSGSPGYAVSVVDSAGIPARWSACAPVRYLVNPSRMPAGALPVVQEAFAYAASVSGVPFTYAGTTTVVPWAGPSGATNAPAGTVVVAFTDAATVPGLAGTTTGLGGVDWRQEPGSPTIVDGALVIDVGDGDLPVRMGPGVTLGGLLVHEIGHVLNLGHSDDPTQAMYPQITAQSTGVFEAGDLAGLNAVRPKPC